METFATIMMALGVLALPVAIIMLIISVIKKKPKKKALIILVVGIILFIAGGIAMPSTPADDDVDSAVTQTNPAAAAIKNGVLQYPSSDNNFKYNIYDTYVEITEYIGSQSASSLTVPAKLENLPVYVIKHDTFDKCEVPTIIFEDGIYDINSGFSGSVKKIVLPSTLDFVGYGTFKNCYALESVVIPEGIDSIQANAFECCSSLKNITIPSTVKAINTETFAFCSALENVTIGSGVTQIGERAFLSCKNLKKLVIPDNVTIIGADAFQGTGLTEITIPASVTKVGSGLFNACEDLMKVTALNPDMEILNAEGYTVSLLFTSTSPNLKVYGKAGSTIAQAAAKENKYFELIS